MSYGFRHGVRIFQDPLTGVLDRKALEQGIAEKAVAQSVRRLNPVAVALIDVDDLTGVNNTDGHSAGDKLLRNVAKALEKGIPREADMVIRYGGDEFLLILFNADKAGAQVAMSRVETHLPDGVHISFGICDSVPKTGREKVSLFDMIAMADGLMYENKRANKAERRKIKGE